MIYFTQKAMNQIGKKFFYVELADGSKAIVYKSDKAKAQDALKKEKYNNKISMYSITDETIASKDNIYFLGVADESSFAKKIAKILKNEKLKLIGLKDGTNWSALFFFEGEKECEQIHPEWTNGIVSFVNNGDKKVRMNNYLGLQELLEKLEKLELSSSKR